MEFHDFTVFDVFYKDNKIYLILSVNIDPVDENNLDIKIDGKTIHLNEKIIRWSKWGNESTIILIYDYIPDVATTEELHSVIETDITQRNTDLELKQEVTDASGVPSKPNEVTIKYNNITCTQKVSLVVTGSDKKNLALTTLFKNDYYLFPIFYQYYKKQGVEHFYMYYNGILTDEIKDYFHYDDVTLIEWNFRYWSPPTSTGITPHHAQMAQIHHAIYKYGKTNYNYMIFNDLDEYLYIPDQKLIDFIKANPEIDTFGFHNIWSITVDKNIPDTFPDTIITDTQKIHYGRRSKNIHKLDSIKTIGIHVHNSYQNNINPKRIHGLDMYHFYNWTKRNRAIKLDTQLTTLNLDFLEK